MLQWTNYPPTLNFIAPFNDHFKTFATTSLFVFLPLFVPFNRTHTHFIIYMNFIVDASRCTVHNRLVVFNAQRPGINFVNRRNHSVTVHTTNAFLQYVYIYVLISYVYNILDSLYHYYFIHYTALKTIRRKRAH